MVLVAGTATRPVLAEDWGAYSLIPASAPAFVLEAVGSGTSEGTVVSIGKPAGTANQKWVITPKGNDLYSIRPSYSSSLVLAAAQGGVKIGTPIVLETDRGNRGSSGRSRRTRTGPTVSSPSMPRKRAGSSRRQAEPGGQDRLVDEQSGRSTSGVDDQAARRLHAPVAGGAVESRSQRPMSRPRSSRKPSSRARSRTSRFRAAPSSRAPCGR